MQLQCTGDLAQHWSEVKTNIFWHVTQYVWSGLSDHGTITRAFWSRGPLAVNNLWLTIFLHRSSTTTEAAVFLKREYERKESTQAELTVDNWERTKQKYNHITKHPLTPPPATVQHLLATLLHVRTVKPWLWLLPLLFLLLPQPPAGDIRRERTGKQCAR